jgi:hypothetical protein
MAVISSDTFNPLLRYVGVRLQQGVPIVDADWNELEDVRKFELRAFLKWFVGDGVPEGSDGFRIVGTGAASDATIAAGAAAPPGTSDFDTGLRYVGRCLVDGRDAIIQADTTLRGQALHVSQAGAAALAAAWSVPTVPELPAIDALLILYLDVWDRLVTPDEQPALIFGGLGTESCARQKREWVVRFTTGATVPAPGDPDHLPGHSYYALAEVRRRVATPNITADDVSDRRARRLIALPATLIEDLFATSSDRYRTGLDRPSVSLRTAINALMRGELPSSPDSVIAPSVATDAMSYAFNFTGSQDVLGFWHSNRVGGVNQVFAVRWDKDNLASAAAAPPQQVTSGPLQHRLPHAMELPNGDYLVVYESDGRDIHFKRAPQLAGLNAAPEVAVATNPEFERHPFVVRVDTLLVFFWHRNDATPRWFYRRRQYDATWNEASATWLDAAGVQLSSLAAAAPGASVGDFHAVADGAGSIYTAFRTADDNVAVARLSPATASIENWGNLTLGTSVPGEPHQQAFLVQDGTAAVFAFFRAGTQGILQRRFDVATNTWEASATLVPNTNASGDADSRPSAVRDADGAIWLFWASERSGNRDIWLVRRNPASGAFGDPRQVVSASGLDDVPFALLSTSGVIWLFWQSQRSGQLDLYAKTLVTAV